MALNAYFAAAKRPKDTPKPKPDCPAFSRLINFPENPSSVLACHYELMNMMSQWPVIIKTTIATCDYYHPERLTRQWLDDSTVHLIGALIHVGFASRIGDDIYLGGLSVEHLFKVYEYMLKQFEEDGYHKLEAAKTIVGPGKLDIMCWEWQSGPTVTVCPSQIEPLVNAPEPSAVAELRLWIGSYKHIARCIRSYAIRLAKLQLVCIGKKFIEKIEWTADLRAEFQLAQQALRNAPTVTVPSPRDQLTIVTDGRIRHVGSDQYAGAVLYFTRAGTTKIGGFFSGKLNKKETVHWIPCEKEALSIRMACDHWERELNINQNTVNILTDSKACVQEFRRLKNGNEVKKSAVRVSPLMSVLVRYGKLDVARLPGARGQNVPRDYLPRTPIECTDGHCLACVIAMHS